MKTMEAFGWDVINQLMKLVALMQITEKPDCPENLTNLLKMVLEEQIRLQREDDIESYISEVRHAREQMRLYY